MSNIAETLDKIGEAFEDYRTRSERRIEMIETKMAIANTMGYNRPGTASTEGPTETERKAFANLLRTGDRSYALEAKATINAGTTGQGLETVAAWFDNMVLNQAYSHAPLLKIVRTRNVGNFPAKHIVGLANTATSGWVGELGSRTDTDSPLPTAVEVPAGEWYALPAISEWALSDLNFDVEQWLRGELITEYSNSVQTAVVSGNGTNKPTGFLAGPTPVTTGDSLRAFGTLKYHPTGQAATLPTTTQTLIPMLLDVVHGLQWHHRQNASWVMNALTMSELRKFLDSTNRPVLLDSMMAGQPATLLGFPIIECEAMPAIGAGAFPIAFGDFDAGYILDQDAGGMRITRDDITTKGTIKYYSRRRLGGKILDSNAIRLIKVAAT